VTVRCRFFSSWFLFKCLCIEKRLFHPENSMLKRHLQSVGGWVGNFFRRRGAISVAGERKRACFGAFSLHCTKKRIAEFFKLFGAKRLRRLYHVINDDTTRACNFHINFLCEL
jgi:hypothetical protein